MSKNIPILGFGIFLGYALHSLINAMRELTVILKPYELTRSELKARTSVTAFLRPCQFEDENYVTSILLFRLTKNY